MRGHWEASQIVPGALRLCLSLLFAFKLPPKNMDSISQITFTEAKLGKEMKTKAKPSLIGCKKELVLAPRADIGAALLSSRCLSLDIF